LHRRDGRRDIADGANSDANAGGDHNAFAHSTARDGHVDCCSRSESNRDGHGDDGSKPGPDRDGESEPELRADGNSESGAESYADADENAGTHIDTHPIARNASADAIPENQPVVLELESVESGEAVVHGTRTAAS
jgi:hypothetical protein